MADRVDRGPVMGGLTSGLVTAVCCGGLPLFASIGLGTFFAGLRLWRFNPLLVAGGMCTIIVLNWLFYRRKALGGMAVDDARRAMLVNTGIGLVFMAAAIFALDRFEASGLINVEQYEHGEPSNAGHEEDNDSHKETASAGSLEEPPDAPAGTLIIAVTSIPFGLGTVSLLPFAAAYARFREGSVASAAADRAMRVAAAIGLISLALVHLLKAPDEFREIPYQGWMFVALILASLALAGTLLRGRTDDRVFKAVGGLAALTALLYALSRLGMLPGIQSADDPGNWGDPHGIAGLFIETGLVGLCAGVLIARRRARRALVRNGGIT